MTNSVLKLDDVPNIVEQIEAAMIPIPFENSDFQTRAFVIAAQQTPARAYRAILLRMNSKIEAIKHHKITRARKQIDIEEKEAKIADPSTSSFDRRRLELDILEIRDSEKLGDKLLGDALHELGCLYAEFVKFPTYTREQFEREEGVHFDLRLNRQLKAPNGSLESLINIREDLPAMDGRIALIAAQLTQREDNAPHALG